MDPIRVLLADDHTLVRAGLRLIIEQIPGVEVVAEASDGREALQLIPKTHPAIVLMDISMADLNGLEATAYISQDYPEVRVIILSMHSDERHVIQAVRAGAVGYVLKDAVKSELEVALRSVMRGDVYLSAAVSKYVLTNYRRQLRGEPQEDPKETGDSGQLTTPERELLQLIAEGRTTKEIAAKLHLSIKAIEARRARLMDRLDIRDLAGLVRYAIRIGLVSAET
ncbi:MAG: response regulator transcription factor [Deltaproteobacteria bacterium]|nr:response regulator transcription factor [Deltaproteobacteria bacterium]